MTAGKTANWRVKTMYICTALLACGIGAYFGLIWARTSQAVYNFMHPVRKHAVTPSKTDEFAALTEVSFQTADQLTIRGWYVPTSNSAVVILAHGWGEDRSQLLFEARVLAKHHFGVLMFDWRAHGKSDGVKSTLGDYERRDLTAALDFIARQPGVDKNRIGVIGFSMGAWIVSSVAAADKRISALVIEGSVTTLEEMLRSDFSKGRRFGEWAAVSAARRFGVDVDAVRPINSLGLVHPRPVLVINGDAGDVDPHMGARLYHAIGQPKEYWVVKGARHGEYARAAPHEYATRILDFFDRSLVEKKGS